MNFLKRAGLSLWFRKGKTLIMLATFLAISAMVLGGVLIRDATVRAGDAAKNKIGADVTMGMDMNKLTQSGGMPQAPQITTSTVDKIADSPLVKRYNYQSYYPTGFTDDVTYEGASEAKADPSSGMPPLVVGALESDAMPGFSSGSQKLLDGKPITRADRDRTVVLIEERFAKRNNLKTGDKLKLGRIEADASTGQEKVAEYIEFTVAGIYRDSAEQDPDYLTPAGNGLITPIGAAAKHLGGGQSEAVTVSKATFTLDNPNDLKAFEKQAKDKAAAELDGFAFMINDKAVKQMTGPLSAVASSATAAMWLIGIAGAAVLALLTTLAVKQRRKEFGVLLSMGEQKWKLVAQQVTEIVVVATLAIGLSSLFAEQLTQKAAGSMVSSEASAAQKKLNAWKPPPPGSTGLSEGIDMNDKPVEGADPIDKITVRLDNGALATVAGVGLGIGLLATTIPAASVLRLSPRTILSKGK
ncbi:ABC transporter permease [Streptomyces sp. NPDC015032]|uniref:ABC transporter permease n=1 Tax=Streptomyces sp. NPDC015032 TaxID=3364937 RepID=UPI0037008C57